MSPPQTTKGTRRRKNKKKSVKIKWQGIKKIDDYSQLVLDIAININNYELLETEKEK